MAIGQNAMAQSFTVPGTDQVHVLGTRMQAADGKEYIYVQADGAVVANDVLILSTAFQADQASTTSAAGAVGQLAAVAPAAFADNEYGWVQIHGACTVNVGSSAAANTKLNVTATAGRVDDDATSGAETILGLYTTAAEASNEAAGFLSYPFFDATL